ncbi:CBS domain-containing protein [Haloechinothrix salitolerans]
MTVRRETEIATAAKLLCDRGFTALPVVNDDDELVGIVTEADLVARRFPPDPRYRSGPDDGVILARAGSTVADVMTTDVLTARTGTDVAALAEQMLTRHVRSVPVVEGDRVIGVVSRRDLVRTLARDDNMVARDVRHRLEIYGGPLRWTVSVHNGVARIRDTRDDLTDRHVATVIAESVPGVTRAEVR